MILDGDLNGTIDQENDFLILFEETWDLRDYEKTMSIFGHLDCVLDQLEERARKLKVN